MTTVTSIDYRAATCNMGEASEQDADNYRAWAAEMIASEYPEAVVEVLDEDRQTVVTADDYDDEISALEFCASLWDRYPWSGEYFE
jgi:hypothetical protein